VGGDHLFAKRLGALSGRRQRQLPDALLAGCWMAIGTLQIVFPEAGPWREPDAGMFASPGVLTWVLTFAVCAPVLIQRRFPLGALFVSMTAVLGLIAGDQLVGLLPFVECILLYTVGTRCTHRQSATAFGYVLAGLLLTMWSDYPNFDVGAVVRNALLLGACLVLGMLFAASRRNSNARLELAEQRSLVVTQRAETAVVEERLRLAQELHDIVAHSMSVISVQASMGSAAFDVQPGQARRALANIERTSHETLAELRGLLGVLRHAHGARADLSPAPSLSHLGPLIANVETSGLTVDLSIEGDLDLPAGADAFGYRVVQEALTNVLKHADASAVSIDIADRHGELTLLVRDDGRGAAIGQAAPANGHGIVGMRERVATFGGTLRVGPIAGGGFEVSASIPYGSYSDHTPHRGSRPNVEADT
jgi:signal transduction histidine kinase